MHAQASKQQPRNGRSAFVHGPTPPEDNWADKAHDHYSVAVGAARESEKDNGVQDLYKEKTTLENALKEKDREHAEIVKKESENHEKVQTH